MKIAKRTISLNEQPTFLRASTTASLSSPEVACLASYCSDPSFSLFSLEALSDTPEGTGAAGGVLLPPQLWLSSWGCLISSMKASAIFAELLRISAATNGNLKKESSFNSLLVSLSLIRWIFWSAGRKFDELHEVFLPCEEFHQPLVLRLSLCYCLLLREKKLQSWSSSWNFFLIQDLQYLLCAKSKST